MMTHIQLNRDSIEAGWIMTASLSQFYLLLVILFWLLKSPPGFFLVEKFALLKSATPVHHLPVILRLIQIGTCVCGP